MGGAIVLLLAAGIVTVVAVRYRRIPDPGREPLDLGPALQRLARDGRRITPPAGPASDPAHVRLLNPTEVVYDWRREGEPSCTDD